MISGNVAARLSEDRSHLLHPLYHPDDDVKPYILAKGQGSNWKAKGKPDPERA